MGEKKSMWVLFGILVISVWVLGPPFRRGSDNELQILRLFG